MNFKTSLLPSSVIRPFSREKGGLLCFVYYMMFIAVGRANGVGTIEYHYSLIKGMLNHTSFLLVVFGVWLVYSLICAQFVLRTFRKPEFSYLSMLALLNNKKLFSLLLSTHAVLFLPVLTYAIVILIVGYWHQWYISTTAVFLFNLVVVPALALWSLWSFRRPVKTSLTIRWTLPSTFQKKFYSGFLVSYILAESKGVYILTKVYTCGMLYFLLNNRVPEQERDMRMIVLFYFFGLVGHGIIIHRLKQVENTRLTFYRTMPVPLLQRFLEYAVFYLLIFLPEILFIILRAPTFITYFESAYFIFFGFGTLLLLNSLQLFNYTGIRDYFKSILQLFIVFSLSLISNTHMHFSILVFAFAGVLFFMRYYNFEPQPDNVMR